MAEYKLGEIESLFADMIWQEEPLTSRRLAELAEQKLNWKRTTTYTVLKRLCDRGLFQNQGGHRYSSGKPAGILCPAERAVCGGCLSGIFACFPGGLWQSEETDGGRTAGSPVHH